MRRFELRGLQWMGGLAAANARERAGRKSGTWLSRHIWDEEERGS
jgi:hypothetical protein